MTAQQLSTCGNLPVPKHNRSSTQQPERSHHTVSHLSTGLTLINARNYFSFWPNFYCHLTYTSTQDDLSSAPPRSTRSRITRSLQYPLICCHHQTSLASTNSHQALVSSSLSSSPQPDLIRSRYLLQAVYTIQGYNKWYGRKSKPVAKM